MEQHDHTSVQAIQGIEDCLDSIHRHLFEGIYKFAGTYRDYNITKPELVLRGDTVRYESGNMISDTLEYEFDTEKKYSDKTC